MYKYVINYKDFDGVNKTKNLYFHLTTAEVLDLEYVNGYKIAEKAKDIIDGSKSNDEKLMEKGNIAAYTLFKDIIKASYGVKNQNGEFIKRTPDGTPLYLGFETTEAYSEFFMKLLTDGNLAGQFLNEIIPTQQIQDFANKARGTQYNTQNINNQIAQNQMENKLPQNTYPSTPIGNDTFSTSLY